MNLPRVGRHVFISTMPAGCWVHFRAFLFCFHSLTYPLIRSSASAQPFLALALLGVLTACAVSKEVPEVSVDQKRCTSLEAFLTYSAQNPRYAGSKVAQVQDTHLDHFVAAFNATGTPTSYDPDRVHIIVSPNGYGVVIFINDNCVTDAGEFPWALIMAWGEGRVPEGKQDTRV